MQKVSAYAERDRKNRRSHHHPVNPRHRQQLVANIDRELRFNLHYDHRVRVLVFDSSGMVIFS